jgi:hypothetical protein
MKSKLFLMRSDLSAVGPHVSMVEGKMAGDYSGFFGFILGALMAAAVCGVMLFATGNFVTNSSNMKIESPIISAEK